MTLLLTFLIFVGLDVFAEVTMKPCCIAIIITGYFILYAAAQTVQNETAGLRCYSCSATGGNNFCEDYDTYKQAMDGKGYNFVKKDCTYPYNVTCFIETFAVLGNTVSHIRDCGDGVRFSFSSNLQANRSAYKRLEDLVANNETACVWDGNHQVCLSKCDTNFCNGPQLEEITSGAIWINISTGLLVFLFLANIFQRQY